MCVFEMHVHENQNSTTICNNDFSEQVKYLSVQDPEGLSSNSFEKHKL